MPLRCEHFILSVLFCVRALVSAWFMLRPKVIFDAITGIWMLLQYAFEVGSLIL